LARNDRFEGQRKRETQGIHIEFVITPSPGCDTFTGHLAYMAQAPNRNRDIIQETTPDVNRRTPISMFLSQHHRTQAEQEGQQLQNTSSTA
jgi:hypothetical protein